MVDDDDGYEFIEDQYVERAIQSVEVETVLIPEEFSGVSVTCYWEYESDIILVDMNEEYYAVDSILDLKSGEMTRLGSNIYPTVSMNSVVYVSADQQSLIFPRRGVINVREMLESNDPYFKINDIVCDNDTEVHDYYRVPEVSVDYMIFVLTTEGLAMLRFNETNASAYTDPTETIKDYGYASYISLIQDYGLMSVVGNRLILGGKVFVRFLFEGCIEIDEFTINGVTEDALSYLSREGSSVDNIPSPACCGLDMFSHATRDHWCA